MKLVSFLTTLALASAAIVPRQQAEVETTTDFTLTDFSFSGSRMSLYTFYRFNLVESTSRASTYCSWTTSTQPSFSSFGLVPCKNSSVSFAWELASTGAADGWRLTVTRRPLDKGLNQTATKFFPASDVHQTEEQNEQWEYQYLVADQTQVLPWTRGGVETQ